MSAASPKTAALLRLTVIIGSLGGPVAGAPKIHTDKMFLFTEFKLGS